MAQSTELLRNFVIFCLIPTGIGFLLEQDKCVWYGRCGNGWNRGKLNCPADPTTVSAPLLRDPEGLRIVRDYCPSLYKGENATRTCCSVDQLKDIKRNMGLPKTFLGHCPACFHNFANLFCQMTCSPVQSRFLMANNKAPKPVSYTTGIPRVTYVVSTDYANGLFDSCVEVQSLFGLKVIGFLCGRSASQCTPQNWLSYLGDVNVGHAPFPIDFVITDSTTWTAPDGYQLKPLPNINARCNKALTTQSTVLGKAKCACKECKASQPCIANPRPTRATRKKYFDTVFGVGKYETVEIIVKRADDQNRIVHALPPPSTATVAFTSIYDQQFLHQVLDLQNAVSQITTTSNGAPVSLDNVCLKLTNQKVCVIESVVQYYQNNASEIDSVVYDDYGIFVLASYLDHFIQCAGDPTISKDSLAYHMACGTNFGGVTQPYTVLEGYHGFVLFSVLARLFSEKTAKNCLSPGEADFQNATAFVITFLLKTDGSPTQRRAWKNAFVAFMGSYSNPNMTITYNPSSQTVFRSISLDDKAADEDTITAEKVVSVN